jgi:hypothetical protein
MPHQFPVTFFNLEKLNGENAQISYSKRIGKWIVCSKNVALAANSLQEAEATYASEQRFKFCLYIARHWFNGCLSTAKNIDEMKDLMNSTTFVGEVCDVSENQHIVDNPVKQGLIFFAIVPKTPSGPGTALCQLPDQAIPIFEKFNLLHVDMQSSCVVSTREEFPKLEKFVDELTVDASPDPYVCLSEGAVVYATDRMGKVLFLSKVKTTKYRILRRVRELLKNAASPRGASDDANKLRTRFRQDLKKWGFTDPTEVSAYMLLIEACNSVRQSQKWPLDKISWRFIDFLHAAVAEIKAGKVSLPAPTVDLDDEAVPSGVKIDGDEPKKAKGLRGRRKPKGKGKPKHEVESSDDEDRAFSALPGDVKLE